MNINWANIRPINGDQKEGFEEFITQLARKEEIAEKEQFVRKGKPDAGVECFWILKDKTEWAWQAKYFLSSLDASQWQQIDDSVKTAIEKHKQLVKYFIAIPIDPPDARLKNQRTLLDKWNTHVAKWKDWAQKLSRDIEFIPWWSSDLMVRLQKPENSGFLLFWFDQQSFTDDWFLQKNKIAVANLGARYTPEINFDLPIARIFDGIARDGKFTEQLREIVDKLLIGIKKINGDFGDLQITEHLATIKGSVESLNNVFLDFLKNSEGNFDFARFQIILSTISSVLSNLQDRIHSLTAGATPEIKENLNHLSYQINKSYTSIERGETFFNGGITKLFNNPYLLMDGEAGIGKSHLFADIVVNRQKAHKPSILLLGQHFNGQTDPKQQILDQLSLKCSFDEFLEALNCKGQEVGDRVILFLDAINEGAGKEFWPDHFTGFVQSISNYKWIGLACSIRSSYIELLHENLEHLSVLLTRQTHYGFLNQEYQASKLFFKNYNIELPSVPLLHPEFQNPLFLKLFCEGLQKSGHTKIPDGINGVTSVFDFFLTSVNRKLAAPKSFNFVSGLNIVKEIVFGIVKYKIDNNLLYVSIEATVQLIADIQKKYDIHGNLAAALFSEGILSRNLFWKADQTSEEGVYIAYERFEDHLIVEERLSKVNVSQINDAFKENGPLFSFTKDELSISRNRGIIEALAIQLPEKFNLELFEIVKMPRADHVLAETFVKSLLWRKNEPKIKQAVVEYINNTVLKFQHSRDYFWDTVIAVSTNPKHFFNSKKTHEVLSRNSLPERDAWWTQLIHYWYNEEHSLKRLIDWAWSDEDKSHISDESMELAAIMLSWFFVSTNRKLRDSATKALVCILSERLNLARNLLQHFENVNDPYVNERIYAAAYGGVLRAKHTESLVSLCEHIYAAIFDKKEVYPHVLLRDYARSIIEYTVLQGVSLNINIDKVRPPYQSTFPTIPQDSDIEKLDRDYQSPDFKDHFWSINSILMSMEVEHTRDGKNAMYGDFGRYVFQSKFHDWKQLNPVDLKNIAVKKVFDLGYDVELHGRFDRRLSSGDRHSHRQERIGKKYQWIALYDLLARVSDSYKMTNPGDYGSKDAQLVDFHGPWEPFVRNIDPTIVFRGDSKTPEKIKQSVVYDNWLGSNQQWLKDISDLPNPSKIIEDESGEWLMLKGHVDLTEERLLGTEKYALPQKQFWYIINSYFVPEQQYEAVYAWLSEQTLSGRWMAEAPRHYEIFSREYYWSPAYKYFRTDYYEGSGEFTIRDDGDSKEIGIAMFTTEEYSWESEYDLSKDEAIGFLKPASVLVQDLKLTYRGEETYMYSETGELVCFDNSEGNDNHSCFYIKKSFLIDFLKRNKYKIIWTSLSEKNIIGGNDRASYGRWPVLSGYFHLDGRKVCGNTVPDYRDE